MASTSTPGAHGTASAGGQNKARAWEDRFSELSLDLVCVVSFDGYVTHGNDAWTRLLGWTAAELGEIPYVERIHSDDRKRTIDEVTRLAQSGGEARDFELRFLARDGRWVWLLFSARAVPDERAIYAVAKDITERKRAEEALREAEERFRSAFDHAPIGMALTGLDGRFIEVNRALSQITGRTVEGLTGTPVRDITHPDDSAADSEAMRAMTAGETDTFTQEKRYLRPDGRAVWVDLSVVLMRDAAGEPLYFISQMEDIDERRAAERALTESEQRFRAVTQSVNDAVISADSSGLIVFWSESAQAIFGHTSEEALGQPLTLLMPARYREAHEQGFARVQAGGEPRVVGKSTVALDGLRKDGSEFPIELSLGEWRVDGRTFYTGVVRDVSERRDAAVELQRRNAELQRSNAELEQFAYVASHDLSEPLRMVSGFVQLLQTRYEGRLDDDADEFIGYTVDGVNRMQELINDLLAYSRVGRSEREDGPVDCNSVLAATRVSLAAAIADSGAEIEAGCLPVVLGEQREIAQLMQNLLSNAIKFCDAEEPRVQVGARRDGEFWELHVTDNGIGIEPRHAERIFKMFQRLHGRDDYPGTGIGLAICKKIVDRGGGRICVEAMPGGGSAFRFTLPAVDGEDG